MRFFLLLGCTIGLTNSLVDFSNSALYDIFDFKGVSEVYIKKCEYGCLIFAATMGESFDNPQKLDPYAVNLYIKDNNNEGNSVSIATLAQQKDENNRKIPLTITGQKGISVMNRNDPSTKDYFNIVFYVVEKTTAETFSYEVYDYAYSVNTKITSQVNIITVMSAWNFRVQAEPTGQSNSVTARLVGFDNALESNKDGCPYAYKTPVSWTFPGFTLMSAGPILSIVNEKKITLEFKLDGQYDTSRGMTPDGFFCSSGWNGCTKPNNGGIQSFRPRDDASTDMYLLDGKGTKFNVSMEVLPNFDADHKLTITDNNIFDPTVVNGTVQQQLFFQETDELIIDLAHMINDQGFILRYSSVIIPKPTTTGPITASSSNAETTTSTQPPPTTSSGFRAAGCLFSTLLISPFFL